MVWMKKARQAEVVDARPWMIAPHSWLSASRLVASGASVSITISARADAATVIPSGTVIGHIPAEYRPLTDVYVQGQNLGSPGTSEGIRFMPNGDITAPAVDANSYFKVSAAWTR